MSEQGIPPPGWPEVDPLAEPTDRPLKLGDPISDTIPLFIVAAGPNVGAIGTEAALSQVPGRVLLAEGAVYDPLEFPDLARRLRPYWGEHRVPSLSNPEWL